MRRNKKRPGPLFRIWGIFFVFGMFGALAAKLAVVAPAHGEPPAPVTASAQDAASGQDLSASLARLKAEEEPRAWVHRLTSLAGILALILICAALSNHRAGIPWRMVGWGVLLQIAFAVLVLKTAPGLWAFSKLNGMVLALLAFSRQGTDFLLRSFVTGRVENGYVNLLFHVLPTIIFFSSLMTVGYHLGLMQRVVNFFAVLMQRTMRCSGAETLSTAANIFVGQTEAPLVIKPYVGNMTQSELLTVMAGGFANTAGGVLAAYVGMLHPYFPDIAGHLIAQSVMSAPAALVCAKIIFPERETPQTAGHVSMEKEKLDANLIDAAARGASEGLTLTFNVAAMLLAFIALIALANAVLAKTCLLLGAPALSLESLAGLPGAAFAFLMGVPWSDCWTVGKLLGVKTVLNEFVAYLQLAGILQSGPPISYRAVLVASYALSGFANFGSLAIQIGGISGIAPSRRHDLARLGLKALAAGALANFMTAAVAGMLL